MGEFTFFALILFMCLCFIIAELPTKPYSLKEEPTLVLILELCQRFNNAAGRFWKLVLWNLAPLLRSFNLRCWRSGMRTFHILHSMDWSLVIHCLESAWGDFKTLAGVAFDRESYLPYLALAFLGIELFTRFISRFTSKKLTIPYPGKLGILVMCG